MGRCNVTYRENMAYTVQKWLYRWSCRLG